jgi:DNA-binding NarL/FixJ family response regulator
VVDPAHPVRVLVADDHAVFRLGMRRLLDAVPGFDVVGETADTDAVVAACHELRPDVVVMDLDMPGGGGVVATERLAASCPGTRVLVLTMHADSARVRQALAVGARGYVVKDSPPDDILRAIEAVHADQTIVGGAMTAALLTGAPASSRSAFPQLTEREHDVLERMSTGVPNDAIADRLGISVKTVQNHVSNVLLKLGVSTRAAAVARARDAGLGGPP